MNAISIKQSKPHYAILDGLRGVAALVVVLFHALETYAATTYGAEARYFQIINHGYLAVDFFFMLSGFVVAYAYDDRWGKMSLKDFFKRRIIRLQPMVIVGGLIGGALFYFSHSEGMGWGGIADVPVWKMLLVMLIGLTMIPVGKGLDIRGWGEMYPLNGPAWSLFYEYVANIAYALFLRRATKVVLWILTLAAAAWTLYFALTNPQGDLIGGFDLSNHHLTVGFTRLCFPFLAGMLIARFAKLKFTPKAFLTTSIMIIVLLSVPRIGGHDAHWMNGLYECFCLFLMFPLIIWLGAGGQVEGALPKKLCKFLGDISYPIYITHYPLMYVQMAIIANNKMTFANSWWITLLFVIASVVLAYFSMKLADIPVRKWLAKRFL